jgi:hypothetical protein
MNNIEVELEKGYENYRLPDPDNVNDPIEAVKTSCSFLEIAPARITAPLLGMVYAAPLSEIIPPDFTLWLWGGSGSYKSTIAGLALSHFGDFSEANLPLSFESTSNALERSLFLAKDALTVVDDWRPGVTRSDSDDMDRKAQRLLRGVGNRQGRNRMTADTELRTSYPPRGAVVATAKTLPEGPAFQSASARALCVNISRDQVALDKLTQMQGDKGNLSSAMAGYITFLASRYGNLNRELPGHHERFRAHIRTLLTAGSHPRASGYAATLIIGLRNLRDYSVYVGAFSEAEAERLYKQGREGVLEATRAHTEATSGGDPASRFTEILRSLFDAKEVFVVDRKNGSQPPQCWTLGWSEVKDDDEDEHIRAKSYTKPYNAKAIGWADKDHLYLNKDVAYAAVAGFAQRNGVPFGVKPGMVWDALARSGKSLSDKERTDTSVRIQGSTKRVVQLLRSAVFDMEHEQAG